jgi:hypothetical protein
MAWNTMTLKQLKHRIIFLTICTIVGSAQLALAADMNVNPIDAAERVERLGTIGILTFTLILSGLGNLYLLRLLGTKIISIIEKSTEAHERTAAATERVITAVTDVTKTIEHCKQTRH